MKNFTIHQQISNSGIVLPTAPKPVGNYKAMMLAGNMAYFSGQLPLLDGSLKYHGKIGVALSVEDGYKAAELCALNVLSQIKRYENIHTFSQIIRIDGYINCKEGFAEHAAVLDGASNLFYSVLGKNGEHARSVIGCSSLPLDATVELVVIAEVL